jgi:hypothetical protein
MRQVRVALAFVEAVIAKLMGGHWDEIYREHGISKE